MSTFEEPLIGQTPAASSNIIIDTDQKNFMADVIEASNTIPILVDFWAPWCGPCRQFTPVLEKVIQAAQGRVRLVKLDIEANQSLAAQLSQMGLPLQSIPLVVAFWKGQVLDAVQGAQSESAVKRFVETVLKESGGAMPATEMLSAGKKALSEGLAAEAAGLFGAVLETEEENPEAWGGIIRALIALNETEAAEDASSQVPSKLDAHPEITGARAALTFHKESAQAAAQLDTLKQKALASPDDFTVRLELAAALNAAGQRTEAAETLLSIIRAERDWNDGAARTELLRFFEAWGHTDPNTLAARRKLSALLFS
ncbi:thioredoxin [Neokomagataea thailandica NBRC 106555]|uniref:Co-chaperone YbbN n=2 Tax=Neokomagataea TaxID=1223423 RepID=A0A4Y6V689_9PROT|nr:MULTISPECIES: tetratricopeptide repeat protein [Neokomagataea]QDH24894.1 co-chaperone YbbN [Neokomagataea tanensis]GBR54104.1 thioredoxin [Neokomagataea thailandica NBRC 106555]